MIVDGLWDAFNLYHMGVTAENLAHRHSITREQQDAYAALSQQRAAAAIAAGHFDSQIAPVLVPQRKGDPLPFTRDEQPRADTTAATLAKLRPAFDKDGTVTAGNASTLNDGAAAVLLMSADARAASRIADPGEDCRVRQRWRRSRVHGRGPDPSDTPLPPPRRLVTERRGSHRSE